MTQGRWRMTRADGRGRLRREEQSSEPMTEGGLRLGPDVGYDSHRVIEDSTNDEIGILSHEGTDAAVGVCQGDGPEQSPLSVTTPQKAPNEANLESTQSNYSQEVESENAEPAGRERSQFAAGGRVVQGAGNDRVETIMPAGEGGGKARGHVGPSLPEAASQDVVPDEQCLPIVGTQHSRSPDATSAKRPKTSLAAIAAAAILRRRRGQP